MIKIKIKNCIREGKDSQIDSGLNRVQKYNLNFLLQKEYEHSNRGAGDTIVDNFIEDMASQDFDRTGDFDIYDKLDSEVNPVDIMRVLVEQSPSLKSSKISQAITGDSYGKIFKLNNQHILKIFLGGVNVEKDLEWYEKCYEVTQTGKKTSLLPVYEKPIKIDLPGYDVWCVEIAEVNPLDKWMKRTGRGDATTIVKQTEALFNLFYVEQGIRDFDQLVSAFINFIFPGKEKAFHTEYEEKLEVDIEKIIKTLKPLSRKEVVALIKVFFDMVELGFELSDVAPRNMGVLEQDPETIVIFDR